jgi:hypothetical protein
MLSFFISIQLLLNYDRLLPVRSFLRPCKTITVVDIDGNIYHTVPIGTQCWLIENLKVSKYRDGSPIPVDITGGPSGNDGDQLWGNKSMGSRSVYKNDTSYFQDYGYLYNWYAVADPKGICPTGWHVPSVNEKNIMTTFLTDHRQFSAFPGGFRSSDGYFNLMNNFGFFWTSKESNFDKAWLFYLTTNNNMMSTDQISKTIGASVRCIQD